MTGEDHHVHSSRSTIRAVFRLVLGWIRASCCNQILFQQHVNSLLRLESLIPSFFMESEPVGSPGVNATSCDILWRPETKQMLHTFSLTHLFIFIRPWFGISVEAGWQAVVCGFSLSAVFVEIQVTWCSSQENRPAHVTLQAPDWVSISYVSWIQPKIMPHPQVFHFMA